VKLEAGNCARIVPWVSRRLAALVAVGLLMAGRAAPLATCACPDCPINGSCRSETPPPCCSDEGETSPADKSCDCPHLEAPEGVTEAGFLALHPDVVDVVSPEVAVQSGTFEVVVPTPRGPGPPGLRVPLFLRDLSLRL
jgi:hypothetical protein